MKVELKYDGYVEDEVGKITVAEIIRKSLKAGNILAIRIREISSEKQEDQQFESIEGCAAIR